MGKVKYFTDYLRKIWGEQQPIAKLFKTDSSYYLYDTGTNKVLQCRKEVFDLMGKLYFKPTDSAVEEFISTYGENEFLSAAGEIEAAIKEEHILSAKDAVDFSFSPHFNDFREKLKSSVKNVCLELTEKCNLRCDYCVNSFRFQSNKSPGTKEMDVNVAYKAVDFLQRHSQKSDKVFVSFYGGEPLLQFDVIKDCAAYAKGIFKEKELFFNITTNATLMTPEIADFFHRNNFLVLVSLDGPREYHDRYRKDIKGSGSYEKTINGLKMLINTYSDTRKIGVNIVYTPPYSKHKLDNISKYLKELSWLPEINIKITYPTGESLPLMDVSAHDLEEDIDLGQWGFDMFSSDYEAADPLAKSALELKLGRFMQRLVFKEPVGRHSLNGCCLPGEKRCSFPPTAIFMYAKKYRGTPR